MKMKKNERYYEIREKILKFWKKKHGKLISQKKSEEKLDMILEMIPDDDGMKRVTAIPDGTTHLVPVEDMIMYGLKGNEITKYPLAEEENEENGNE